MPKITELSSRDGFNLRPPDWELILSGLIRVADEGACQKVVQRLHTAVAR